MSLSDQKLTGFSKKITQLADQPNMQPQELKAYFDSSPEELRQVHNGLCDALCASDAAAGLGFARTAGVPADTVQAAVENVQQQVRDAVVGNIPSGSVDGDKLAQDVRDRFTAIESAAATEVSTRTSGDSNLQTQINTLNTKKCEVFIGTYVGDGAATHTIELGFRPHAVFSCTSDAQIRYGDFKYGGLALDGYPAMDGALAVVDNGFTVQYDSKPSAFLNITGDVYYYIAFH